MAPSYGGEGEQSEDAIGRALVTVGGAVTLTLLTLYVGVFFLISLMATSTPITPRMSWFCGRNVNIRQVGWEAVAVICLSLANLTQNPVTDAFLVTLLPSVCTTLCFSLFFPSCTDTKLDESSCVGESRRAK